MHNYGNFLVCNSKTFDFSNEMNLKHFELRLSTISPGNYFGFQGNSGVARMDDSTEAPIQKFPIP